MAKHWTRRQVLAQIGIAAAAVHTLDPHELCCAVPAHAKTTDKELFELKKVGDGVYAAVAAAAYKVNSNAAVIMTNDGVVVVDSHSKPSAARAVYKEIQGITNKPVRKIINTHFHWDHWQGNEVYAAANPGLEIVASQRTRENLTRPDAGAGGIPFIEKQLAGVPSEIEKLKGDIMRASNPEMKSRLEANLQQGRSVLAGAQAAQADAADPNRVDHGDPARAGARDPAPPARPGQHRRRSLHLPAEGKSGRDRGCADRLDALLQRRLPRGMGADVECAREARLHAHHPRPRGGAPQGASDVLPRVSDGSHHRGQDGVGRRRDARGDAEEDRGSARAEVRAGHVQVPARPVSGPHRAERRDGLPQSREEGLTTLSTSTVADGPGFSSGSVRGADHNRPLRDTPVRLACTRPAGFVLAGVEKNLDWRGVECHQTPRTRLARRVQNRRSPGSVESEDIRDPR